MEKKVQSFFGIDEKELIELLKGILTPEEFKTLFDDIKHLQLNKEIGTTEKLLATTSLYKLAIPVKCQRGLVRSAWNKMSHDNVADELSSKLGYNPLVDKGYRLKLKRHSLSEDEFDVISEKYYRYFGANQACEKVEDCVKHEYIRNIGNKGKIYIIESYKLLKEQIELLSSKNISSMTGDELLEENVRRSIYNVEMNFEKIVNLLNNTAEKTGGVVIFRTSKLLTMGKDNDILQLLATYSDDATNSGHLSGYDGQSGFTRLVRNI